MTVELTLPHGEVTSMAVGVAGECIVVLLNSLENRDKRTGVALVGTGGEELARDAMATGTVGYAPQRRYGAALPAIRATSSSVRGS